MKPSSLLRHLTTLLAAGSLLFTAGTALAQTTKTTTGIFKSTDGNSGTYVRTFTSDGDMRSDTVVYTRSSDQATSTDTTQTTINADKSRTVSYSHTNFAGTGTYTSSKTIGKVKGGRTGTGFYKDSDGTSGTFTVLASGASDVNVESSVFTSSTGVVTNVLRTEEDTLGFVAIKRIVLNPDGTTDATITTRYITGHAG